MKKRLLNLFLSILLFAALLAVVSPATAQQAVDRDRTYIFY
jgi:ABC-type transporter MlaC component